MNRQYLIAERIAKYELLQGLTIPFYISSVYLQQFI